MNYQLWRSDLIFSTRKRLGGLTFALIWIVSWNVYAATGNDAETASAARLLESVKLQMLQALRDPDVRANEERLDSVVRSVLLPNVDMPIASQFVAAGHWKKATTEQRAEFIFEFERFLMRFYLRSLAGYLKSHDIPEDFMVIGNSAEVGKNGAVLVETTVFSPGGTELPVAYRLHHNGSWRVIDITVAGVSMVLTYRSQFAPILRSEGIEGLTKQLKERNAALANI